MVLSAARDPKFPVKLDPLEQLQRDVLANHQHTQKSMNLVNDRLEAMNQCLKRLDKMFLRLEALESAVERVQTGSPLEPTETAAAGPTSNLSSSGIARAHRKKRARKKAGRSSGKKTKRPGSNDETSTESPGSTTPS